MNYVVVTGYICTGSSVINDLLKEVRGYKDFEIEFKLFTGTDGLLALENALFNNWDPWKSGEALINFQKYAEILGSGLIGKKYGEVFSKNYNVAITHFLDALRLKEYLNGSSVYKSKPKPKYNFGVLHNKYYLELGKKVSEANIHFCDVSHDYFIQCVRLLIDELFNIYEEEGIHTVILDQGITPYYANCFERFFPQGVMFIVDRNPLDTAASLIERGKGIGLHLAKELDANLYVRWYLKLRNNMKHVENRNIYYLSYEKMIRQYDESVKMLFNVLGISPSDHIKKGVYFDPTISVKRIEKYKNYCGGEWHSKVEWDIFCQEVIDLLNKKNHPLEEWI